MKTILFATDYSELSEYALLAPTSLARHCGAKLLIVHVCETERWPVGELFDEDCEPSSEELRRLAEVVPDDLEVPFEHRLVYPPPFSENGQEAARNRQSCRAGRCVCCRSGHARSHWCEPFLGGECGRSRDAAGTLSRDNHKEANSENRASSRRRLLASNTHSLSCPSQKLHPAVFPPDMTYVSPGDAQERGQGHLLRQTRWSG